jgi:hypothetical protein
MSAGATKNLISCASPGMNDPILHADDPVPSLPEKHNHRHEQL